MQLKFLKSFGITLSAAIILSSIAVLDIRGDVSTTDVATNKALKSMAFNFSVKKGQYFLWAFSTTAEKVIRPLGAVHCSEDYELVLTVFPTEQKQDQTVWRQEMKFRQVGKDNWGGIQVQDSIGEKLQIEDAPAILEDVSKIGSLAGIQLWRIPYGKVNGETRSILLAIADDTDVFAKLFMLPKTPQYEKHDWKKSWAEWPRSK